MTAMPCVIPPCSRASACWRPAAEPAWCWFHTAPWSPCASQRFAVGNRHAHLWQRPPFYLGKPYISLGPAAHPISLGGWRLAAAAQVRVGKSAPLRSRVGLALALRCLFHSTPLGDARSGPSAMRRRGARPRASPSKPPGFLHHAGSAFAGSAARICRCFIPGLDRGHLQRQGLMAVALVIFAAGSGETASFASLRVCGPGRGVPRSRASGISGGLLPFGTRRPTILTLAVMIATCSSPQNAPHRRPVTPGTGA